ncbi:MAG: glycosyltransferase family 25 protein [Burkholderiales bacterium]|jgi:glycosyl transferase family 25|nr:glycosyltransferase family 25 protein [Burkholderiales bacterium]
MSDFPCFVVNLEKDKERRTAIDEQLRRHNIPHTFSPAVHGAALSGDELLKVYDEKKARDRQRELALPEIGCALSHYAIYREMVRQNLPYALILEDDVRLADHTLAVLSGLSHALDRDKPTVVLLNHVRRYKPRPSILLTSTHGLFNVYGREVGAYAYCLTQSAAQNLMRALYPVFRQCDEWGDFAAEGMIELKAVVPYCASHNYAFASNLKPERDEIKKRSPQLTKNYFCHWKRIVLTFLGIIKKQPETW